jgi:opacity protein-like surface antigen
MLKRLGFIAIMVSCLQLSAVAQATTDRSRGEFFVGYSNSQIDIGVSDDNEDFDDFFQDRISAHGFNVSGVGNVNRWVGIKGDFSAHFRNFDVDDPFTPSDVFQVDASLYNFLGGIQVKDNDREGARFKPFGHVMVGAAHARTEFNEAFFEGPFCADPDIDCEDVTESETGFAAVFGGGVDVRVNRNFSVRAIQIDYNPTWLGGSTQHNFRFGVGVVFH